MIGGISPLGCRKKLRLLLDSAALHHETILVSAGQRGFQIELKPADLRRVTQAEVVAIT